MEKKSIGQFIAALRKANGMTQRQLAEKLNVSDKAVSRWERDESAPDLMLIPVIAEIFGVTSDELLRGEKKNVETPVSPRAVEKTEKQIEHMLKNVKFKMDIRGIISVCIMVVGLIIAMVCNFGFYRSYLGFYIASVFFLVGLVCEIISVKQAFYSIDNSEYTNDEFGLCKKKIVSNMEVVVIAIVAMFALCLPLVIFGGAYIGIDVLDWFFMGIVLSLIVCILGWIVSLCINTTRANSYGFSEIEVEQAVAINKKKVIYILITIGLVCITGVAQIVFNKLVRAVDLASGKKFYELQDFIEYMETPYDEEFVDGVLVNVITESSIDGEFGIDESDYIDYIYNDDGEEVAKYVCRNNAINDIKYDWTGDNELASVTVYTQADFKTGNKILDIINWIWVIIYIVEIVIMVIKYNKKAKQI